IALHAWPHGILDTDRSVPALSATGVFSLNRGKSLGSVGLGRKNSQGAHIAGRHVAWSTSVSQLLGFTMSVLLRLAIFVVAVCRSQSCSLLAQPASPPPPAKYEATIRYRITSARDQHVVEYDALVDDLKKLGFEFDPPLDRRPRSDREDPTKNIL